MHPRNRDRDGYDFHALLGAAPELKAFVSPHPCGGDTIDFSDPNAVTELNHALLKLHYGIQHWEIPRGYLCPAVPGRADYIHHVADLLASDNGGSIPRGDAVTAFDIGVGANAIYPIIGVKEYDWRFMGSDIDATALESASRIVAGHAALKSRVILRLQPNANELFAGIARVGETFALCLCNPPFHASEAQASAGTLRKLRNLGECATAPLRLNFGGRANELWCLGGEPGFIDRMIRQSAAVPALCGWFTTLVSKSSSLSAIHHALKKVQALEVRTIPMAQGQKQSRIVAWSYLPAQHRRR